MTLIDNHQRTGGPEFYKTAERGSKRVPEQKDSRAIIILSYR